jgi:hypothetical protein
MPGHTQPDKPCRSQNRYSLRDAAAQRTLCNCDPSYPDFCIPPPPPDLDCDEVNGSDFTVLPPDPHGFDGNSDGSGLRELEKAPCLPWQPIFCRMCFDHPFDHPDDRSGAAGAVWTDEAPNVSRLDPSCAVQGDADHPSRNRKGSSTIGPPGAGCPTGAPRGWRTVADLIEVSATPIAAA